MLEINETQAWREAHPGGIIGLLELSGVDNSIPSNQLNQYKREVEAALREKYAGFTRQEINKLPVMDAYRAYYRRFKKTYHVQLQVESIVLKGRNLPDVSPLVDANFSAEVETLVLTAGHDVDQLQPPVVMDVSSEGDQITQMNGEIRPIRPGDMVMRDADGVSCSIIYGQDNRSPITPRTTRVLYVAYAPPGVLPEQVTLQLDKIVEYVTVFSPGILIEGQRLIQA